MLRKKTECSWRYIQRCDANNDVVNTEEYSSEESLSSNSEEEKDSLNINNYTQ